MSLRSTCIEAMAESAPAWLTRNAEPIWVDALCVLHLDALLGVLEEHVDEWEDLAFERFITAGIGPVELLTVLREDT